MRLVLSTHGVSVTSSDDLMCLVTELCRCWPAAGLYCMSRAAARGVATRHRGQRLRIGIRFQNPISRPSSGQCWRLWKDLLMSGVKQSRKPAHQRHTRWALNSNDKASIIHFMLRSQTKQTLAHFVSYLKHLTILIVMIR